MTGAAPANAQAAASGPVLVCATAPRQKVLEFLARLDKARTLVLASALNGPFYAEQGFRVLTHRGRRLHWTDLGVLAAVLRQGVQTAVFVTGEAAFHDNVVRALSFWKSLRPELELYQSVNAQIPCARLAAQHFSRSAHAALALLFFLALAGTWLFLGPQALAGLLAALVLAEGLLRLRDAQDAYAQRLKTAGLHLTHLVRHVECRSETVFRDTRHPVLGWDNGPAQQTRVRLENTHQPGSHEFVETIDAHRRRVTAPAGAPAAAPGAQRVAVLGCSYTFGWGVSDAESYPYLLQQAQPHRQVVNHGVPAHSLYQCLLALEAQPASGGPDWVVLGFHEQLEERNTGAFDWISYITGSRPPSAVNIFGRLLRFRPCGYRSLRLSSSLALASLLEYGLNRLCRVRRGDRKIVRATCEHLLLKLKALCEKRGARLVVVLVNRADSYRDFLRRHNFHVCDPQVDTVAEPGRYSLLPFDLHINAAGHARIAQELAATMDAMEQNRYRHPVFAGSATPGKISVFYQHF